MSDLQCAATLLIARHGEADAGGDLTAHGREQARALGRSVRDARLAVVYTGPLGPSLRTAEVVEVETGVPVVVREELVAWSVSEMEAIADLHRGETVLVVSGTGAENDGCAVVEVTVDADGWSVRR